MLVAMNATKSKSATQGQDQPALPPKYSDSASQLPRLAFTMRETAGMLGLSYISIHRLIKRGLLKSSLALRHKLISKSEIERFLKA